MAWEYDLMLFLACWCSDLKTPFHLQTPWSFRASTAPILVATIQALQAPLIFFFFPLILIWMRKRALEGEKWGSGTSWFLLFGKWTEQSLYTGGSDKNQGSGTSCLASVFFFKLFLIKSSPVQSRCLVCLFRWESVVMGNQNLVLAPLFGANSHVSFSLSIKFPEKEEDFFCFFFFFQIGLTTKTLFDSLKWKEINFLFFL